MRDWMLVGALFILLPLAFRSAFNAYLLWGWGGLIALHTYMYGFMRSVPLVQVFALITLFLILQKKDKEIAPFNINPAAFLMIVFAFHGVLCALFAYPSLYRNWELCSNQLKTILFCILMPMLVTKRYRLHAMLVVLAIGVSFHGLIEGLKFVSSGGAHHSQGNEKLGDNNHFAMIMIMVMPVLLYLFQYAKYQISRLAYAAVFLITCLAVVSTNSRGGLLTLGAVAMWLIMLSRRKVMGIVVVALVAGLVVAVAPESWTNRMNTIETAEQDGSFMGRVIAWKRASAIALDNPVFGGGFHAGQDPVVFEQYRNAQGLLGFVNTPDAYYAAATHSIYFEVMGDLGFVGLILFMAVMTYPFIIRVQINRLAKKIGPSARWASDCGDMLGASMVAYLVGGAALSAAYFELPYMVVMLMQVLQLQLAKQYGAISSESRKINPVIESGEIT